jgi:hypothetical protein
MKVPPDREPTQSDEAFPTYHVPAFHYANPVTGKRVVRTQSPRSSP